MSHQKCLIVNVDDGANHPDTTRATLELYKMGRISSTSIMVYGPDFPDTSKVLAQHSMPYGIHLGVHHGKPISNPNDVPSLCRADGSFYDHINDNLQTMQVFEVEIELRAQLDTALRAGLKPQHIDCHTGFLYMRDDLRALFQKLALEYKLHASLPEHLVFNPTRHALADIGKKGSDALHMFFELPDAMKDNPVEQRVSQFKPMLASLEPGLHYLASHPMLDDPETRKIMGGMDFRVADYEFFKSEAWPDLLKKNEIKLSYFPS